MIIILIPVLSTVTIGSSNPKISDKRIGIVILIQTITKKIAILNLYKLSLTFASLIIKVYTL